MCGVECIDTWATPLIPAYRPPKGGFRIESLPESVASEQLQWAWKNRKKGTNTNANACIAEALHFLKLNGIQTTKAIAQELRYQATDEWCGNEPARCRGRKTVAAEPALARKVEVQAVIPKAKRKVKSGGCKSCGGGLIR